MKTLHIVLYCLCVSLVSVACDKDTNSPPKEKPIHTALETAKPQTGSNRLVYENLLPGVDQADFYNFVADLYGIPLADAKQKSDCGVQDSIGLLKPTFGKMETRYFNGSNSMEYCLFQARGLAHSAPIAGLRAVFINNKMVEARFSYPAEQHDIQKTELSQRFGEGRTIAVKENEVTTTNYSATLWKVAQNLFAIYQNKYQTILVVQAPKTLEKMTKVRHTQIIAPPVQPRSSQEIEKDLNEVNAILKEIKKMDHKEK